MNTYYDEEMAFLSGKEAARHCNGGVFDEIWEIKYPTLLQNSAKPG